MFSQERETSLQANGRYQHTCIMERFIHPYSVGQVMLWLGVLQNAYMIMHSQCLTFIWRYVQISNIKLKLCHKSNIHTCKISMQCSVYVPKDVHVTGFAAELCGIDRLHHRGFHPENPKTFNIKKDILAHYVNSSTKQKIFKQFKT